MGRAEDRPRQVFDEGLQHERTALAWERTAISTMVAGVLVARYAAESLHWAVSSIGIMGVVLGGILLVWTGRRYENLHGPLRAGENPAHPAAARVVGLATVTFTGVSLVIAVVIAVRG